MNKVLNVVCVYFSIPFFFGDQFDYFKKLGYDITISCSQCPELPKYAQIHDCNYTFVNIQRKISPISDLKAIWKLYKYIRKTKPDIVCGHTPKGGLIAMTAAFLARVKKRVFFRHGLVYETSHGLKRFLLINAERYTSFLSNQVVCVSPYLVERSIQDKLSRKSKLTLLNIGSCTGIDAYNRFNPDKIDDNLVSKLKSDYKIDKNDFIIGYTGRLVVDKGIIETVQAFVKFNKKYQNSKLLLVGPLEERDSVPQNIVDIIINHQNIIHTGLIPNEQIHTYYKLMDVLVLSTHREGFGVSIIEASSMCVPVLTTSHTGSRDAIIDGETGMYIQMNPESISDKLELYYKNPELKLKHGYNGRNHVLKNFEQSIIWKEIEQKVYKDKIKIF